MDISGETSKDSNFRNQGEIVTGGAISSRLPAITVIPLRVLSKALGRVLATSWNLLSGEKKYNVIIGVGKQDRGNRRNSRIE
ncbi:hypothetical protein CHS0354_033741 [Potamilus streckersoni]|uniref:Uncharacterized protein n=1 Tax=Potamilus streckersoni TaxID=2493646 RepID=A0AAE0S290_9BIVA|nr:hypothetical protein CHS0354_033741 [Potamilus streckersoni]